MAFFAIALVILGNLVYHLGQRAIPREANAVVATLAAYVVALVATLAMVPVLARGVPLGTAWRTLNASTLAVGTGIVAIELGFLLAYRAGLVISTASITANAAVAVLLLLVGAVAFREPVTPARVAGIGFCLLGLWLITRP